MTDAVYRLSPFRISPPYNGTAFPVWKYARPRSGSTTPTSQTPAPPLDQLSFSFGQVSCPGSPGPGTVKNVQSFLPVLASNATTRPRSAQSPLARPTITIPSA